MIIRRRTKINGRLGKVTEHAPEYVARNLRESQEVAIFAEELLCAEKEGALLGKELGYDFPYRAIIRRRHRIETRRRKQQTIPRDWFKYEPVLFHL